MRTSGADLHEGVRGARARAGEASSTSKPSSASPREAEYGNTSDKYVRTTVFLASVLFLIGISTHFPIRSGRYALIAVGLAVLVFSLVQLAQLPRPPA